MDIVEGEDGGRIYFSSAGRTLAEEDEICLLSVGVDIGSSTSHLVFSRIVMERREGRYMVIERDTFYQSGILLTPYVCAGHLDGEEAIDAQALGAFIRRQYEDAQVDPDEIDTGALILTGIAAQRSNARRIGDLFAASAGKMVAVSAGDSLETVMAAWGSGAVARSLQEAAVVMNVDVGGGTAKIAVCRAGDVVALTALDVGARLICVDDTGHVTRLEAAGVRYADSLGTALEVGAPLPDAAITAIAAVMADRLFDAMAGGAPHIGATSLLRLAPLAFSGKIDVVTFSGGVAEYIYGRETAGFGDLGGPLAAAITQRLENFGARLEPAAHGIRATVVGASQYTTQVSGSTIFVSPQGTLPLRNVPVIVPAMDLSAERLDGNLIAQAIRAALTRLDLGSGDTPVAIFAPWSGSATYARLDALCRGVVDGLSGILAHGHPIVLVGDSDVGGLIGIHFRNEMRLETPVVSIDGLELKEFDYIDIGELLQSSGAVPVAIKSLVFPGGIMPARHARA